MRQDCIICAMPPLEVRSPPLAPYQLKGYLSSLGYKIQCIDFNIKLWHELTDKLPFKKRKMNVFKIRDEFEPYYQKNLEPIIKLWAKDLVEMESNWIGLSIFSIQGQFITEKLCSCIKKLNSKQKIVIGGAGVRWGCETLLKNQLVDAYIKGDGEFSLASLLAGEKNIQGINGMGYSKTIMGLNIKSFPDFNDVNFSDYPSKPTVYIQGSKGCVRKCKFCDVNIGVDKFQFNTGNRTATELINSYETYNIQIFIFADSLINGPLNSMREMCNTLISYKTDKLAEFTWSAHFIVRPKGQMLDKDFALMKKSGCSLIKIGVESGSERVRKEMGKNFSNNDLEHLLSQCLKNDIKVLILLMVGYPTETEEDFQETLKLIDFISKYKDIIQSIQLGSTVAILPDTYLHIHNKELGINLNLHRDDSKYIMREWNKGDNTFLSRLKRQKKLETYIKEKNLKNLMDNSLDAVLDNLIEEYKNK